MPTFTQLNSYSVAVIGAGPAGLMAAELLSQSGVRVEVYDAMPSVGRKFLMAGKGGMNITHSEPLQSFLDRYGSRCEQIKPMLDGFSPNALREWVQGLGIDTFVGSSGRVFPTDMKAAPLLRAWLHRLRENGVVFFMRHRWTGWNTAGELCFSSPKGEHQLAVATHAQRSAFISHARESGGVSAIHHVDAVVLALGGGSWPQLGSTGDWVPWLTKIGVSVAPLRSANCGFDVAWSEHLRSRFIGHPLKAVVISFTNAAGKVYRKQGDCMITSNGIEGGVIYALSAFLRNEIDTQGSATIYIDLLPGKDFARVLAELAHPRGSRSLSSHLQSRVGLKGVQTCLLRESLTVDYFADPVRLSRCIKALPLRLIAPRPLAEAISSAGGVTFEALDRHLMLSSMPGIFCAGEMLDWEAPTGGYLLTACFASGRAAGAGVMAWLQP